MAIFISSGNVPFNNDKLQMCVKGTRIYSHDILKQSALISSHPGLELFRCLIILVISIGKTGDKKMEFCMRFIFCVMLPETLGIFFDKFGPIFTKKSLEPSAISFLSDIIRSFLRNVDCIRVLPALSIIPL